MKDAFHFHSDSFANAVRMCCIQICGFVKELQSFFCPWPKERNRRGPGPVSDSHSLNASTFTVAFGSSVRQAAFGINCGRDRSVQYSGKMN